MPKVTRKRVSLLQSPVLRFAGLVSGTAGLIALGAIFFGLSDKGAIDVSGKINATDQSGFATKVNPMSNSAAMTNGGLKPMEGGAPVEEAQAPTPEPVPETASSTATSTDAAASSTEQTPEQGGLNPDASQQ